MGDDDAGNMARVDGIGLKLVAKHIFPRDNESVTPAMTEDTLLPFDLPVAQRKQVTADFEGGLDRRRSGAAA